MPITTYLHDGEYLKPTRNCDVNETLGDVLKATGEDWRVQEIAIRRKAWLLGRSRERFLYSLYLRVSEFGEFQCINFYSEHSGTSINICISADALVAFLLGILTRADRSNQKGKEEA